MNATNEEARSSRMVNLEDEVVEQIIEALGKYDDGAEGVPGHKTGDLITMLKAKLQDAKKPR
jgi:hypothetical protein